MCPKHYPLYPYSTSRIPYPQPPPGGTIPRIPYSKRRNEQQRVTPGGNKYREEMWAPTRGRGGHGAQYRGVLVYRRRAPCTEHSHTHAPPHPLPSSTFRYFQSGELRRSRSSVMFSLMGELRVCGPGVRVQGAMGGYGSYG